MKVAWIVRITAALLIGALSIVEPASAAVSVSVRIGPPPLPVYAQPVVPGEGYVWAPGYWAWSAELQDYYWVPGTWVLAPRPGLLWTPAYWAWDRGGFIFHEGYWGPHVGFYGGINYGFGYTGVGYQGGYWRGPHFYYNESVTHVDKTVVRNVYNKTVINNDVTVNRVSFNGGSGGVQAQPTAEDRAAAKEQHVPPVADQRKQEQVAQSNPQLRASANNGRPAIAATQRPAELTGKGVTAATNPEEPKEQAQARASQGAEGRTSAKEESQPNNSAGGALQSKAAPAHNAGSNETDERERADRQAMRDRQDRERQDLQARQDDERKRFDQAPADERGRQQMEEEHARQTQELKDRHDRENAEFEQRYSVRNDNGEKKKDTRQEEDNGNS